MTLAIDLQEELVAAAKKASQQAYSPYSGFHVGAAVLTESGDIFTGCNVENASYGLTMCAERSAIFQAVAGGSSHVKALAIYTPTERPTPPCGACRQVLIEFGAEAEVICICDGPEKLVASASDLLAYSFGGKNL